MGCLSSHPRPPPLRKDLGEGVVQERWGWEECTEASGGGQGDLGVVVEREWERGERRGPDGCRGMEKEDEEEE